MYLFWKNRDFIGWPLLAWRLLWMVPYLLSYALFLVFEALVFGPSQAGRRIDRRGGR